jgi:hypothetical protein
MKIDILLSHVNVTKLSTITWSSKHQKISFSEKTRKNGKNRKKPTTFFNPETDPDLDQKPTFEQKTNPDPDRLPKVNPAGLYG